MGKVEVNDYVSELSDLEAGSSTRSASPTRPFRTRYTGLVRLKAYIFDGFGEYCDKEWDIVEGDGKKFCWYHVELPKGNQKLSQSAQYLIDALCPPLKLQDILSLVSNGPYCAHVDGALVFRVNSPGPPSSKFTFRLAARITKNSVITVSLGRVPRLGFSPVGQSLLMAYDNGTGRQIYYTTTTQGATVVAQQQQPQQLQQNVQQQYQAMVAAQENGSNVITGNIKEFM
nr:Mg2+ transporter protein, CorA-like/zinc transport protein ZntB [Tanacetum cinerariifolium]